MDISQTAKLVYSLLLDRTALSKKHGWIDKQNRIYIIFPIAHIAAATRKGITAVKDALHELDSAGLIERKRNFSAPNTIYVLLPDSRETGQTSAGKPAIVEPEKRPCDSRENGRRTAGKPAIVEPEKRPCDSRENGRRTAGKPAPNQTNKKQTDKKQTNKRVALARQSYGSYGNVLLTDTEYQKLSADIPYLDNLIEQLSAYMESSGKKYKSHAATLRVWAARDRNQQKPRSSGMPDYSFKEGESL